MTASRSAMARRDVLPVLCGCLEGLVKPDFYGFPYRALSEEFKRKRQQVMWACVFEMVRRRHQSFPAGNPAWCAVT